MPSTLREVSPEVAEIVARHPESRGSLIPILQDVQAAFGYLAEEAVQDLEQLVGISANEIYGVATFYTQFRFSPPGDHKVQVCQGTACHVRGGNLLLRDFSSRLGIDPGETTEDGRFSLERVACLGCCALAPVVAVDGKVHAEVNAKNVPGILAQYNGKKDGGKK